MMVQNIKTKFSDSFRPHPIHREIEIHLPKKATFNI